MRSCSALAGVVAVMLALMGAPSAMAACSLKAFPIAVKMAGLRPTVPAKVNGKDVTFLVDSGAFFNGINAKFALEQKIRPAKAAETGSHINSAAETLVSGLAGMQKVSALVKADEFEFAGVRFRNAVFLTLNISADGLIGQNFLGKWDVEYDFRDQVMKLVDVQGCKDNNMAYWVTSGTYSIMPLDRVQSGDEHTSGTVFINGVKMQAQFDTGAGASFITQRAAARAGVKTTDPGVKDAGYDHGVDGKPIKTWVGRFASVKIGDEEIKNGLLTIGQTAADSFDILIGADFFLSHHVYVANSQQKLYFSYSGGQVFNVSSPQEAAPAETGNAIGQTN